MSDDEILEYLALCESYSNHYIAKSILTSYGKEIDKERIKEHSEIAGHGIKAVIDGKEVLAGNKSLMDNQNIKVDVEDTVGTVIYIAIDKKYSGNVVLSDELKDNVLELSNNLKRICGIKILYC